ncbi:hypothetical protein JQU17_14295 [Ponticoccus sp. SC2-23]|uniref:DUF6732 family protein n=1 Tax=Alexandriicola marinus TaxID=2081710 RepID=UPI000FDC2B4A|nr:DUF6732 family protein [Alexandriicola marinus]MBM1221960.1 hypothetical protein [Ponticoccus sp. SC6-9]MBM1226311.1 hypothetical protein [Ponticoccus sp. SC6-15]MBM1230907.1 hypothetical protein [Ponticoccus sp. SC6-38]MBM1235252.1 hypothetical protein [Ponticoccus sp. SC6-45]MBM1239929.1 hypothetical protein [Ponticoccus sp. SC6-49]MBM1244073.1 hypothetical protein [Ponticoccus sp. SC2-64]MBM1248776.1 hypothetical protein [Ponticoccus sp. SC6-42]MBM1253584.1 hypothetical protein [Ponti
MRKLIAPLFLLPVAGPAIAHPGHLSGLAGHDHWVAGAAIGLAIAVGVWGALKGRRKDEAAEQAGEPEAETEEQAA